MFDPTNPIAAPSCLTSPAAVTYTVFASFLQQDTRDFPIAYRLDRLESLYKVVSEAYLDGQQNCECVFTEKAWDIVSPLSSPPYVTGGIAPQVQEEPVWSGGIASGSIRTTPLEFVATIEI